MKTIDNAHCKKSKYTTISKLLTTRTVKRVSIPQYQNYRQRTL